MRFELKQFKSGIQNRLDLEDIAKDSAQDSLNWLTIDGKLELARGNQILGNESSISGGAKRSHTAYKVDGTRVDFRQTKTSIQYLNNGVWTNTNVTNLSSDAQFTWTNYQSLYQNAVFIAGPKGLYKINVANPANVLVYAAPVLATDRHIWGYMRILDGRAYRWNITQPSTDLTALYLSWVDKAYITGSTQTNIVLGTGDGTQTTFTGTLSLTNYQQPQGILFNTNPVTVGGYCDLNGVVQWPGVTGTVNLTTGAYSMTFATAPAAARQIRATYVLVDDTNGGVLQNIKTGSYTSAIAFENKSLRQDEGGDAIKDVQFGIDGNIFSFKASVTYRYVGDSTDTSPKNEVYRKDLGVSGIDSAVSTSAGIYVINTTNTNYPELILLEKNPLGDNILSTPKMEHFDFSKFSYTQSQMVAWDRFIVCSCKTNISLTYNDRLLMLDLRRNTVDVVPVRSTSLYKDKSELFSCLPDSDNVQKLFTGFVDGNGDPLSNYWVSKWEDYQYEGLKKMKRFFIRGRISTTQNIEIYANLDNQTEVLLGTIRGTQNYVDVSDAGAVGSSGVGEEGVGGGGTLGTVFTYLTEIKTKLPKYRVRYIKFKAIGVGYASIEEFADNRIEASEQRIPKKYRIQGNVSKDGTQTNVYPFPNT